MLFDYGLRLGTLYFITLQKCLFCQFISSWTGQTPFQEGSQNFGGKGRFHCRVAVLAAAQKTVTVTLSTCVTAGWAGGSPQVEGVLGLRICRGTF